MKSWPDIERLMLNRVIEEFGPLPPEVEQQALEEIRAMIEAMPQPTGAPEELPDYSTKS